MAGLDSSFKKEIFKIVLDKLLIGILLVVAGVFANYLVEKYKFEEGFRTELNKTRVARIGEVWENLYIYEASVDNVVDQFRTIVIEENSAEDELKRKEKELPPLIEIQGQTLANLIAASHKNRFWIGEETYLEIINYTNVLEDLMDAYANYDVKRIEEINLKRAQLRQGVRNVRDKLLGE